MIALHVSTCHRFAPVLRRSTRFVSSVAGKCLLVALGLIVTASVTPQTARATLLEIQLGGVNIAYDGTNLFDADPALSDPDPLDTVAFLVDDVMVGSVLTTGISLDLFIPSVLSIPDTGGVVSSAPGGYFDLNLPGGDFMNLDLGSASIVFINLTTIQFTYGGTVAALDGQSLPYGLEMGAPVTVSFSTQVNPASLAVSGGFVDRFAASGTGEIRGTLVPEPAGILLGAVGAVALAALAWRRRTRAS